MSYYVNIDVDNGIGLQDGSDVDNYMGWNQFAPSGGLNYYEIAQSGTYLLRGSKEFTEAERLGNASSGIVHILPWDLSTYGPWRMHCSPYMTISDLSTIAGGIIDGSSDLYISMHDTNISSPIIDTTNIYNCVLISTIDGYVDPGLDFNGGYPIYYNIEGCRIYGQFASFGATSITNMNCVNTVFECAGIEDWDDVTFTFDYCVMKNNPGFGTITNTQTDWTPSGVLTPAWNATEDNWDIAVLNSGIIQAGNGTYTNYSTGLYGNPRKTLGTGKWPAISVYPNRPIHIVKRHINRQSAPNLANRNALSAITQRAKNTFKKLNRL